jgi:outer membrane immunogenic protein
MGSGIALASGASIALIAPAQWLAGRDWRSNRSGHLQFSKRGPARTGAPELTCSLPAGRLRSREVQDRMKKIALIVFLLAVCVAAGRAQESRQDISISGLGIVEPFIASSTDVQVNSTTGYGALASYRFMLTPSSALEANYGITYQNKITFHEPNISPLGATILTRNQEVSAAYVHTFYFRKFNPFIEAGPGAMIFLPIVNSGTTILGPKQQTAIGAMYGAGFAYEISPSFDIRGEFRSFVTKVPNFGDPGGYKFDTNKWYNIFTPAVGVAYHF